MKKRLISLLLILTMMLPMIPVLEVGASSDLAAESVTSSASVVLEETWGNPAQTVDMNLIIVNNPGILGATLTISWDESLTMVSDKSGEAFGNMTYQAPSRYVASGTNFVWSGDNVEQAANGIVLTLSFKISENAKSNDILPVIVTYVRDEVVDGNWNDVSLDITDGSVRVITYVPGDVTGDGKVNIRDLIRLSQYISDGCKTDPEGYNAVVVEDACDVTSDGKVNIRDLIKLSQYISDGCKTDPDGYNSLLKPAKMPECEHLDMQKTEEKKATCTESGNIAYWYCSKCGKYFSDANGKSEVKLSDTVVVAKGHTPVTDDAVVPTYEDTGLTEGSHCGTCGEVFVAQQVVSKLNPSYHSITYRNLQGAESPEITQFAEHLGIAFEDVPEPVRRGYKFLGWFEGSEKGSKKVDEIAVGTTRNITVYAQWEKISYNIRYIDAPVHDNPLTYTIEDEIYLDDPEWSGLVFKYWVNEAGEVIDKIEKGTTENLIITAKWSTHRNLVIKKNDGELLSLYDAEAEKYYFLRELGMISGVVIDDIAETYNKTTDANYTITIKNSVSVSEGVSNGVAEMVATSTMKSEEWQNTHTQQDTWNVKATAGFELGEFKKIKAELEVSGGTTKTDSETHVTGESTTDETSGETTSVLSYTKNMTSESEYSMVIPGSMPNGTYSYVHAADVRVFAVVTYDIAENCYYLDTYSIMGNMYAMLMYSESPYESNASCDALAYDIPVDEITEIIDSSYFVRYDANGGEGEMLCSMHKVGESSALQANQFTRSGYTFAGWRLYTDSGVEVYYDEALVKDIAKKGSYVTLFAAWSANDYKLTYNTENEYGLSVIIGSNDYDVTFDQEYLLPVPQYQYSDYYDFVGWYTSTGEQLTDETGSSLSNWNIAADCTIYAKWTQKYKDYVYINSREGLEAISNRPDRKYMLIDDIDLYSSDWIPLVKFYGELDGHNHTISGMKINDAYEECGLFAASEEATICNLNLKDVLIINTFEGTSYTGSIVGKASTTTIKNCVVAGTIDAGQIETSTMKTIIWSPEVPEWHYYDLFDTCANKLVGHNVDLSCIFDSNDVEDIFVNSRAYIRTSQVYKITDSGRWNQSSDTIDLTKFGINTETMQDPTMESITVTIWLDNCDIDRGNHFLFIYDMNNNWLAEYEFWAPDSGYGTAVYTYKIGLQSIMNNQFKILYGASGDWDDDWYCRALRLQLQF